VLEGSVIRKTGMFYKETALFIHQADAARALLCSIVD